MKYPLFVSCLLGLSGVARAYDAAFAEALDQPGRVFTGSGWEVVLGVYSHDGIDSVANQTTDPHTLKTFATEVTGPSGIRFFASVFNPPQPSTDAPLPMTIEGPGGVSRSAGPGGGGRISFVAPSAGVVTWSTFGFYTMVSSRVDQLEIFDPVMPVAVGQALDQPGTVFMSAATDPWVLTNADTHDGVDALTTNGSYSEFQVTAPAGKNAVSFWAKVEGNPASRLHLIFSGNNIDSAWTSEGTVGWQKVTRMIPTAGATIRWVYGRGTTDGQGSVRIDGLEFSTVTPLQDAIDLVEPVFQVSEDGMPFSRITTDSRDGVDSAESSPGAAASIIETTVNGPAVLIWDSRISAAGAVLSVQVDLNTPWQCRDNTSWAHHAVFIPAGEHAVSFIASDTTGGNARARLDKVKLTPWYGEVIGSGLTFTQSGTAGWERVLPTAGSWTTAAGFVTGERTGIPNSPDTLSPVLSATANGPGWLSYRSSVTAAAANVATLETPVTAQNHSFGTKVVSMAFPGAGPHQLKWALRGAASGVSLQQATVTDVKWTPGGHPMGHPGPWVISDEKIWGHDGRARIDWGFFTSGSRYSTISTKFTGPGALNFTWACRGEPYFFGFSGDLTVRVTGSGNTVTLPMDTNSFPVGSAAASIPIPAGEQTVTWELRSSISQPPMFLFNPPVFTASIGNFTVVNPFTSAMEALDTTLPLSTLNGTWVAESGPGWRGGDCLAVNTGGGTLSVQVTGPRVVSFRGAVTGPYNPSEFGPKFTATGSPGGGSVYFEPFIGMSSPYHGYRALVLPAGMHTVTVSASAAPPPASGYPPVTWKMDLLEAFEPADYAEALDNSHAWTVSGNHGFAPIPQTDETHDGSLAVGFFYQGAMYSGSELSNVSTAGISGPGVVTWWQKGSLRLAVDSAEASVANDAAWIRHAARLTTGPHTLTWSGTGQNAAWLDEVKAGTAFDNWLAGFLTDAQLGDAALFSTSSDIDGDGLTALVEFVLQTSPVAPTPGRLPVLTGDGADPTLMHLTWRQPQTLSGGSVTPQISSDLTLWTSLEAEQTGTDGSEALMRASFRNNSGRPARFARLEVRLGE